MTDALKDRRDRLKARLERSGEFIGKRERIALKKELKAVRRQLSGKGNPAEKAP